MKSGRCLGLPKETEMLYDVEFSGPTRQKITKQISAKNEKQLTRRCYDELKGGLTTFKVVA